MVSPAVSASAQEIRCLWWRSRRKSQIRAAHWRPDLDWTRQPRHLPETPADDLLGEVCVSHFYSITQIYAISNKPGIFLTNLDNFVFIGVINVLRQIRSTLLCVYYYNPRVNAKC